MSCDHRALLVNRANYLTFFLASYVPMASLLVLRCLIGFNPVDTVLAVLVVLYAVQVVLDSSHISQRWDQEALMRFSHEDMSRELEEARDEALIKARGSGSGECFEDRVSCKHESRSCARRSMRFSAFPKSLPANVWARSEVPATRNMQAISTIRVRICCR